QRSIARAIERPHSCARGTTRGSHAAAKEHELRRVVTRSTRLENGGPHIFSVAQYARAEFAVLALARRRRLRARCRTLLRSVSRCGLLRRRRRGTAAQETEHFERIDPEEQAADQNDDDRSEPELHAAAEREAAARSRR